MITIDQELIEKNNIKGVSIVLFLYYRREGLLTLLMVIIDVVDRGVVCFLSHDQRTTTIRRFLLPTSDRDGDGELKRLAQSLAHTKKKRKEEGRKKKTATSSRHDREKGSFSSVRHAVDIIVHSIEKGGKS